MREQNRAVPATAEPLTTRREIYVDFLRAFSLIVVIGFHWVFTILEFDDDVVRANSPIGSTPGAWAITWVLQVMPLFFFVGGYAHWIVWIKVRERGGGWWTFVKGRVRRLVIPGTAVAAAWVVIAVVIGAFHEIEWMGKAVLLVISPMWFLMIYTMLVLLAPLAIWAHRRWGPVVLVFLLGSAAVLDVLRFAHGQEWAGYVNFLMIWGFCHQMGLLYRPLVEAPRQVAWSLLWSGIFALVALTSFGLYPRSMVGVPGDRFSNMGPPTLVIGALLLLQIGLALLVRSRVIDRLTTSRRWAAVNEIANRFSLPAYLFHTSAFALAVTAVYLIFGYAPPAVANPEWWVQRPLWLLLPGLFVVPVILIFSRQAPRVRQAPDPTVAMDSDHQERFW